MPKLDQETIGEIYQKYTKLFQKFDNLIEAYENCREYNKRSCKNLGAQLKQTDKELSDTEKLYNTTSTQLKAGLLEIASKRMEEESQQIISGKTKHFSPNFKDAREKYIEAVKTTRKQRLDINNLKNKVNQGSKFFAHSENPQLQSDVEILMATITRDSKACFIRGSMNKFDDIYSVNPEAAWELLNDDCISKKNY